MRMTITITGREENGDIYEEDLQVPSRFEVCPECEGCGTDRGRSVECDGGGFTASEWNEACAEDDEFAENYFSGRYDRTCEYCRGKRVIEMIDRERADPKVLEQYDAQMEAEADFRAEQAAERRMGC